MNVANISSISKHDFPVGNRFSIMSLCKAPFAGIWKICQYICNVIFYPLKFIARSFQKPQIPTSVSPLPAPSFSSRLMQLQHQAKPYDKQLTFATALSLASLAGMYFYKNCNDEIPDSMAGFDKTIPALFIGGGLTLLAVYASYTYNSNTTPHGQVVVPTTSTVVKSQTLETLPTQTCESLLNDILAEITADTWGTKNVNMKNIYAELYQKAQVELPSSMDIKKYKDLLNTEHLVSTKLASKISALSKSDISEDFFTEHKAELFQVLWHLYVCKNRNDAYKALVDNCMNHDVVTKIINLS